MHRAHLFVICIYFLLNKIFNSVTNILKLKNKCKTTAPDIINHQVVCISLSSCMSKFILANRLHHNVSIYNISHVTLVIKKDANNIDDKIALIFIVICGVNFILNILLYKLNVFYFIRISRDTTIWNYIYTIIPIMCISSRCFYH